MKYNLQSVEERLKAVFGSLGKLLSSPESEMHDKTKGEWRNHLHMRAALLQQQLLTTRDKMNYVEKVKKLQSEEDVKEFDVLKKREATLMEKLAELKKSDTGNDLEMKSTTIYICDSCKREISEKRYHCIECSDFDFCFDCYTNSGHSHPMFEELLGDRNPIDILKDEKSLAGLLCSIFKVFSNRPCLGYRSWNENNELSKEFVWTDYKTVYQRSMNVISGLKTLFNLKPGDKVGISAVNCLEWFFVDFGCMMQGLTVIALHTAFAEDDIDYIVQQADIKAVFCSEDLLPKFKNIRDKQKSALKTIVTFTPLKGTSLVSESDNVSTFSQVEKYGIDHPCELYIGDPSDIATIVYTSGSTGRPKGAVFTNKLWKELGEIGTAAREDPYVSISKDPLSHISDREDVHTTLSRGGRVGIFSGVDHVFEDIMILSPSGLSCTPRFWNHLYSEFMRTFTFEKERFCKNAGKIDVIEIEKIRQNVLKNFKGLLGKRLTSIGCGGAPSSKAVMDFLRECYGPIVDEGYACTEAGQIAREDGTLYAGVQYKLLDVEDYGYSNQDKPFPRGELLLKTPTTISGYFNTEDTNRAFDEEGWFHTGDIVELIGFRRIRIIDRKKNLFKLAQGEFISPEKLENIFLQSKFVKQIFITCGDIRNYEQNAPVCVVVPVQETLVSWASNMSFDSFQSLCKTKEAKQAILTSLAEIGAKSRVRAFEIPCAVHIEPEMFTPDNGKLTPSMKLCRPFLERFYRETVDSLVEEVALQSVENINTLQMQQDRMKALVSEAIGANVNENSSFKAVGGDSLAAIRLMKLIKDQMNVDIPIEQLYDEKNTISALCNVVSGAKNAVVKEDVTGDAVLDNDIVPIKQEDRDESVCVREDSHILITGVTGFVGVYILEELLKQTKAPFIYCLVRAENEEKAALRIQETMEKYAIWREAYKSRIVPLVGSLELPKLGLTDSQLEMLINKVTVIYHCGAAVNHIQSYSALKAANVDGTKELLRIACKGIPKVFNHMSSISVFSSIHLQVSERDSIDGQTTPYTAEGYSKSKWVAEKLVEIARSRGLTANIFRLGMVSWHTETGHYNELDWFNRLVSGVITLGVAPISNSQINLIPVNFVSYAVVRIGQFQYGVKPLGNNFHIVNNQNIRWGTILEELTSFRIPNAQFGTPIHANDWWNYLQSKLKEADSPARRELLSGLLLFANGIPNEDSKVIADHTENYLQAVDKNTGFPPNPPTMHIRTSVPVYLSRLITKTMSLLE